MSDRYLELVNSGIIGKVASQLGLPKPSPLRRTDPKAIDKPLVSGPVVILGTGKDADAIAEALLDWDLDVRRSLPAGGQDVRVGATLVVLTEITSPADLHSPVLELGGLLKRLTRSGRVITVHRDPRGTGDVTLAAARNGVDGFLRSLSKELRYGSTGNGLVLAEDVGVTSTPVIGALRFFLSARSAFVSGQLLPIGSESGQTPPDWTRPLAGKVAVVTGAARGIGAAIAQTLHRDGAQVIGVDVPAAGESLARVMNSISGIALQADITAPDAGSRIIETAQRRFGRLDLFVHNAGVLRDKLLVNMKPEQWDLVIAINVQAQLSLNEQLLAASDTADNPLSPDGLHIVSLASTSGIAGNRGQTNYGYSKAAVIGMVRAQAAAFGPASQHTINAVAPGFIETDMTARIPPIPRQVARRVNSLQQGGQPVDVAEAIAFLAAPQSVGINGQVLRVCGQNVVGQ